MTAGHRHRIIRLRTTGWLYHLLKIPLVTHRNVEAAERSRWVWGERIIPATPGDPGGPEFTLTPLGILHTLTGLTVDTRQEARR